MSNIEGILAGKRIVVVGGAGLLGSRLCSAIVAAGATCAIADVSRERAEKVAQSIVDVYGRKPAVLEVSITDKTSVDIMIDAAAKALGGIDGLVNTAYPRNGNYGRKFEDVAFEDFCENVNLHLGGYFLVSQRILEHFKRNGGGSLLNMSSIYGVIPPRFEVYQGTPMTMPVEYAAIKAAIVHLTKYMAKYYAGSEIRVNAVSLGGLLDAQPQAFLDEYRRFCLDKGMLEPSDVTGTVVFLLSDLGRYINGQNLIVDDGFTL
jgi:NAD(P)-dependent dehydrogenase (short-subunit alcohol dehydrogenase family)